MIVASQVMHVWDDDFVRLCWTLNEFFKIIRNLLLEDPWNWKSFKRPLVLKKTVQDFSGEIVK